MVASLIQVGLVQVGLDRGAAELAALEQLHRALEGRKARVGVSLVTCHRVELYLEGVEPLAALDRFTDWAGSAGGVRPDVRCGDAAARHLLRVTAGLESAILGDDQILGQARAAYREACLERRPGRLLHRLFHAAFRAGRRARSETALKEGTRSLAGAAVAEIARRLGCLTERTVTVIGAGEMARQAARLLAERKVGRLLVVNRTLARARDLAAAVSGEALPWDWKETALGASSAAVLAARVSSPILRAASLAKLSEGRLEPFVVADLGVPRNAERPDLPQGVLELLDVEQLGTVRREKERARGAAIPEVEAIVEEELAGWLAFASVAAPPGRIGLLASDREGITCIR